MSGKPWDHVSASQIETYELCPRKWHFKSVAGFPTPENAAATLGKQVHAEIESYLNGEIPATSLGYYSARVHRAGLLPTPGSVIVEWEIPAGAIEIAGVPVQGFIDVLDLGPVVGNVEDYTAAPVITDWKTRGDPERYSKADEQLLTDVQLNVYAAEVLRVGQAQTIGGFARYNSVDVRHVNIGTKPPHAITVSGPVTLSTSDVNAFFERRIVPAVKRMKIDALKESPLHVTGNPRACSAFGGCPFVKHCNIAAEVAALPIATPNGVPITMPTAKEQLMARIKQAEAGAPAAPSTTTPPPADGATGIRPSDAPASPSSKEALMARIEAGKAANVTAPASTPSAPAAGTPASSPANAAKDVNRKPRKYAESLAALNFDAKQIERMTPPEMHRAIDGKIDARTVSVSAEGIIKPIPAAAPASSAATWTPDLSDLDSCSKYAMEVLGWPEPEIDAMTDAVLLFVAEKQVARSGVIPTYEDGKITDMEEKPAPAPVRAEGAEQVAMGGFVLYINCRPVKGAHVASAINFDDYIAPLGAAVAKSSKVDHYALLDFAEGARKVAALALLNPPRGVLVVSTVSASAPYVLEVLRPLASDIVIGGAA